MGEDIGHMDANTISLEAARSQAEFVEELRTILRMIPPEQT